VQRDDRLTRLQALNTANWDLAFATAFATLVGGNFQAAFALALGADPFLYSFILSLPALLGVLQIPGSQLGERFRSYKRFVGPGWLVWKLAFVPVVFLPLLPQSFPRLTTFILCIAVSSCAVFLVNATYNAWLSFLVPESHRGWYFARRHAIGTVVSVLIGFPASLALDLWQRSGHYSLGFTALFGMGVLFGLASYLFFLRMPDTERENVATGSLADSLRDMRAPLRHRPFRRLMVFLIVFLVGQAIAAPFYFKFGREVLDLRFLDFQFFAAAHAAVTLLSAPLWGYMSDRYGNKPVLFTSGILLAIGPLSWVLTQPGNMPWNYTVLVLGHVAAGFAWTGVIVGQGNIVLAITPPSLRAQGIGLSQAVMTLVGGLAPLVGGLFMEAARSLPPKLQYDILFSANSALRVLSVLFLFGVHDSSSMRIREFLSSLLGLRPRGVLALRKLTRTGGEEERAELLSRLKESKMRLAERDLISFLEDPSPRVRQAAVRALRELGGAEAASALRGFAEAHRELVDADLVDALAALGDTEACKVLGSFVKDSSSPVRSAAARALGVLRCRDSASVLMEAAQDEDPEVRHAAVVALSELDCREAEPILLERVMDPVPSVRLAAARACAEMRLRSAVPRLRVAIAQAGDETVPEIAYALAACGGHAELETILWAATTVRSQLGRRRCLLAVARILSVEDELYRLLLMDPVARDHEVLRLGRSNGRGVEEAVRRYQSGDEAGAVQALAEAIGTEEIRRLAEWETEERFLLALLLATRADRR
jgi:HEAT repeat protein/predicted MFS family arabinose efflux permease